MARYFVTFFALIPFLFHSAAVAVGSALSRIGEAIREAFPAPALARESHSLDEALIRRVADRHRSRSFVARRNARTSVSHRGAPLNAGSASAGLAYG